MRRTNHRSKETALKFGKKELNKRNSKISGFYTRKEGDKKFVNFYYSK